LAFARLLSLGAKEHRAVIEVGGGIRVASLYDPFSNVLGISSTRTSSFRRISSERCKSVCSRFATRSDNNAYCRRWGNQ
jgi:hypothetical protein